MVGINRNAVSPRLGGNWAPSIKTGRVDKTQPIFTPYTKAVVRDIYLRYRKQKEIQEVYRTNAPSGESITEHLPIKFYDFLRYLSTELSAALADPVYKYKTTGPCEKIHVYNENLRRKNEDETEIIDLTDDQSDASDFGEDGSISTVTISDDEAENISDDEAEIFGDDDDEVDNEYGTEDHEDCMIVDVETNISLNFEDVENVIDQGMFDEDAAANASNMLMMDNIDYDNYENARFSSSDENGIEDPPTTEYDDVAVEAREKLADGCNDALDWNEPQNPDEVPNPVTSFRRALEVVLDTKFETSDNDDMSRYPSIPDTLANHPELGETYDFSGQDDYPDNISESSHDSYALRIDEEPSTENEISSNSDAEIEVEPKRRSQRTRLNTQFTVLRNYVVY